MIMKTRKQMIRDARRIRGEIAQIFADAAHWNTCMRKPDEPPLDPDRDGLLARIAKDLDAFLKREKALEKEEGAA